MSRKIEKIELLCVDTDGTLTDGSLIYGNLNSSLGASFALAENFERSQTSSLASRPKFSANTKSPPQILEFEDLNQSNSSDFTESSLRGSVSNEAIQNTNESRDSATKSRPIRGAKNRIQTSSSASADFLLEKDLRGSPPKSEKRQLLARRGSGAGGAALLRKDSSDKDSIDSKADLFIESHKKIDSKFALDSRDLDSSLRATRYAQNDDSVDCHDSAFAESRNDGNIKNANSSIVSEKSGLRSCERGNRTNGSLTKRTTSLHDLSPQDEFVEIAKVFNVKDGLALAYWVKKLNRKVAIITGRSSEILRARAKELGIDELLFMGIRDKGAKVRELKERFALDSSQIATIGDDLNDIPMFKESHFNFAPSDCAEAMKTLPHTTILNAKGGCGAVREAIEIILKKESLYEAFVSQFV